MKDLDIKTLNGTLNIEFRTDGGIGIYYETNDNTLMLDKEQMLKLAGWLITYIEGQKT